MYDRIRRFCSRVAAAILARLDTAVAALRDVPMPRMLGWYVAAALLLLAIALTSPQQVLVALYKLSLISLAGVVGYLLDRSLFPYARPDGYLKHDWRQTPGRQALRADHAVAMGYKQVFAAAQVRRAIVVGAAMLGVALGL